MREREELDVDVLVVGAGVAGLACAIRLSDLLAGDGSPGPPRPWVSGPPRPWVSGRDARRSPPASILVLEKGARVGAHVLSGCVLGARALDALLPDWPARGAPPLRQVTAEEWVWLTPRGRWRLPRLCVPRYAHQRGLYLVSLGELTTWLGEQARERGIGVLEGVAGAELLFSDGAVAGVRCGDAGLLGDGRRGPSYVPGACIRARVTVLAEGAYGSLTQGLLATQGATAARRGQTYSLGLKELWETPAGAFPGGRVLHTLGYPLQGVAPASRRPLLPAGCRRYGRGQQGAFGGGFVYGMDERRVAVGLVLGLDYADPRLDPFDEFQRWKAHPVVREVLAGGKLLMFGAKCLPEGGYDALPPLYADGVLLVGDAAGLLNPARLQGAHLAMQSGIAAAEALAEAWPRGDFSARVLRRYEEVLLGSWVGAELRAFRHWRAAYGRGLWRGRLQDVLRRVGLENALPAAICDLRLAIERPSRDGNAATQSPIANRQSAIPCLAAVPQTPCADADTLAPMRHFPGPRWPGPATPDGPLVLDRAAATAHSGASHREGQPLHLLVLDAELCQRCVAEFAGPCQRVCPSGVYEWECGPDGGGSAGILPATEAGWKPALRGRLLVHAANCLHCKACAIKDPYGNILWKAPEGGGGPKYRGM